MSVSGEWFEGEPAIGDLLSDPLTRTIMEYDGITEADVLAAVEAAGVRIQVRPVPTPAAA